MRLRSGRPGVARAVRGARRPAASLWQARRCSTSSRRSTSSGFRDGQVWTLRRRVKQWRRAAAHRMVFCLPPAEALMDDGDAATQARARLALQSSRSVIRQDLQDVLVVRLRARAKQDQPRDQRGVACLPSKMFRRSRPLASGPPTPRKRVGGMLASLRRLLAPPGGHRHRALAVPFRKIPPAPQYRRFHGRCRIEPPIRESRPPANTSRTACNAS